MPDFVDVILPLALPKPYTYSITPEQKQHLTPGFRVAVSFGKNKVYSAIVVRIHSLSPQTYEPKPVALILDEERPIVTSDQLAFWEWMASYYMCSQGEIIRAALPATFLLESETIVHKREINSALLESLTDEQFLIYEALESASLRIDDLIKITERKNVMPLIQEMLRSEVIELHQQLQEKYRPKYIRYIRLNAKFSKENELKSLFESLQKAPKQLQALVSLFDQNPSGTQWEKVAVLKQKSGVSSTVIRALIDKGIFDEEHQREDRKILPSQVKQTQPKELSKAQETAFNAINESFKTHNSVLFEGVTSSGKTEVYIKLIASQIALGNQVLYLLPEISLTSQIVTRLVSYFGDSVCVYHSKFSPHERTEVYQNILDGKQTAKIIVGARSALFLPFQNLGLIIVDEEHESAYKQFDPAPRYHSRDSALFLGQLVASKVLLGSATPSIESAYNARIGKFAWVQLQERYGGVELPEIETIDLKEATRKKEMKGLFSKQLLAAIDTTLSSNKQVILFQNRRGYAPILECLSCGHTPQCTQCDVTLTYHQSNDQLRCHYCGYHISKPVQCHACGMPTLDTKGAGTQQIQEQIAASFPNHKVARMDWDSTRGKWDFDKIIRAFSNQEIHILVGTQMVVKGLDFKNVQLVGVLSTDQLLNFPDFRAHERSFQMLCQVAGRSGRSAERGKVLLQTFQPDHLTIQQVIAHDYEKLYQVQTKERTTYQYPPFCRLIRITFKNKNYDTVNTAATWFTNVICQSYKGTVLGPVFPAVARVRNLYNKNLLIKLDSKQNISQAKKLLLKTHVSFQSIAAFRSTRVNFDVDPY